MNRIRIFLSVQNEFAVEGRRIADYTFPLNPTLVSTEKGLALYSELFRSCLNLDRKLY